MKKSLKVLVSLVLSGTLVLSLGGCSGNSNNDSSKGDKKVEITDEKDKEIVAQADKFIELLKEEKNEELYEMVDDEFKKNIDYDKFVESNNSIKSLGKIKSITIRNFEKIKDDYVVEYKTDFEQQGLTNFRIALSSDGKIIGYFLQPLPAEEKNEVTENDKFSSEEVVIGEEPWKLPGTLLLPKNTDKKMKAVVLVHGSGPNDRDETIINNKPFKDIAEGLAERGIAVLRYDKRSFTYANELNLGELEMTPESITVDDATEAVNYLKSREEIDENGIYVLGHSIGGYYMPMIYEQNSDLAGYISLAGTVKGDFEDLIIYQYEYLTKLDGAVDEEDEKLLEQAESEYAMVKNLKSGKEVEAEVMFGYPQSYWNELKGYDALKGYDSIEKPMLILQGGNDYQVPLSHYEFYKSELEDKDNIEFKSYDGLTHLFMEGEPTPEAYNVESHVEEEVINDIADWIKNN